jgi:hypothetical protein
MTGASVKDPVRPADREEVYQRDGGCIAPLVDDTAGQCRTRWGEVRPRDWGITHPRNRAVFFTLDHVPRQLGATRISRPRWMVTLCWGHGVISHWETAHRQLERDYLEDIYGPELGDTP